MKTPAPFPTNRDEWRSYPVQLTADELLIGGHQVMQTWERPLMRALAERVTSGGGRILEVGFGMGISAHEIIDCGCEFYEVIEPHPEIARNARQWAAEQPVPVTVHEGFWQDVVGSLEPVYDGILFDTFPLSEAEAGSNHFEFIPVAGRLLRPSGLFGLYSDESLNFRTEHLRLLLESFDEVTFVRVDGLEPPPDCEYWRSGTMVLPFASRPRRQELRGP